MRWSAECQQLSVLIVRTALDEACARRGVTPPAPESLELTMSQQSNAATSWMRLVQWMAADRDHREGVLATEPVASRLDDLVVAGFLAAHVGPRSSETFVGSVAPARLRRVADYIDAQAADPLNTAELAGLARVNVRTLQAGFREYFQVSPTTYVRNARLDGARADLGRSPATVADVAHRWGFAHLPRFAASYRERFGVAPSETLRRSRSRSDGQHQPLPASGRARPRCSP